MSRLLLNASTAIALISASVVVLDTHQASAASLSFDLAPFTALAIESDLSAQVVVGKAQAIMVEAANPDDVRDLRLEVRDGRLYAWLQKNFWDFRSREITIRVSVPSLDRIEASAGATVEATGPNGDLIVVDASSGASVRLSEVTAVKGQFTASSGSDINAAGSCNTATVVVSSAASISAKGLECNNVDVDGSSGGSAAVFARGHVNATASSGASIILAGNPTHVDDDTNSGGDITVLE